MSKIDDRLGLGWEVWFLVLGLAIGGVAALVVPGLIGLAIDVAERNPTPGGPVTIDPRRLAGGVAAAVALAAIAGWIIRTTDWRRD